MCHKGPSLSKISSEALCAHHGAMNPPTDPAWVYKCWDVKGAKGTILPPNSSTASIDAPWCGGCPLLHSHILVLLHWHQAYVMLLMENLFIFLSQRWWWCLGVFHMVI